MFCALQAGNRPVTAPLADPSAQANEDHISAVDSGKSCLYFPSKHLEAQASADGHMPRQGILSFVMGLRLSRELHPSSAALYSCHTIWMPWHTLQWVHKLLQSAKAILLFPSRAQSWKLCSAQLDSHFGRSMSLYLFETMWRKHGQMLPPARLQDQHPRHHLLRVKTNIKAALCRFEACCSCSPQGDRCH